MANPARQLSGDFCETCNCFYVCSCSTSNVVLPPNRDHCIAVLVFHIDRGRVGAAAVDDLAVGLVVSSRTDR